MPNKLFNRSVILRCLSVTTILLTTLVARAPQVAHAARVPDDNDEIVYLSSEGEIQVIDPVRVGGATEVKWRSGNDKNFRDFTLGDVNNDGDMEIIAIGGDANTGRLVVYDPVVTSGVNDGTIDNVPWRKLVQINLAGEPRVVAAGNFDPNVNGDEILVSYVFPANSNSSRLDIYHGTSVNHDGTSWSKHVADQSYPNVWRDSSVGDIIQGGPEEVLLIDSFTGIARVYRPDLGFSPSCEYNRSVDKPFDAVFGQWNSPGSPLEFGVVRTFPSDSTFKFKARFIVFGCNSSNNQATDVDVDNVNHIFRDPFTVTAIDTNRDGEDEFFMLRDLPESLGGSPHLLGRNRKGDINGFEVRLDADNGYDSIASGDIDGDGKGEVAVMRNNNIRVFTNPEEGASGVGKFNNYAVGSNQFSIEIGNLDKNGFEEGYRLVSDRSSVTAALSIGEKLTNATIFTVKLNNELVTKQHNAPTVEGMPAGVQFKFSTDNNDGFTPTTYVMEVDASTATASVARPEQPYTGAIVITSNDPQVLEPLRIPLTLTLNYARLSADPSAVAFVYLDCSGTLQPRSQKVTMRGTAGVSFDVINASVAAANADAIAPWLTVAPLSGNVGDEITFTIDPTKWTSGQYELTSVLIRGDESTGPTINEQIREIQVSTFCAVSQIFLPTIAR